MDVRVFRMIVTFTDFGIEGPYLGQMRASLTRLAPGVPIIDLMVDVPAFDVQAAAYLLPAVMKPLAADTVCLAVVDPGVGGDRLPVILRADEHWFVGPDNGLFELLARRARTPPEWWEITWRAETLSASFHGRDLFAPVAARIAAEGREGVKAVASPCHPDRRPYAVWPDDLAQVIYIDGYGNCMLGVRWEKLGPAPEIRIGANHLPVARTFSDVSPGSPFCYENALGLAEIAVNKGNAAALLGLRPGSQVSVRELSGK
ncbi:MAG: SAM-dependent chlorinase/fluorinase [Rhodospirillales bacterium]